MSHALTDLTAVQFHLPSYLMFVLVSNCYGGGGLTLQVCFNLQKGTTHYYIPQ